MQHNEDSGSAGNPDGDSAEGGLLRTSAAHNHGTFGGIDISLSDGDLARARRPWEHLDKPWNLFTDAWFNILQQGAYLFLVFWLVGGFDEVGVRVTSDSPDKTSASLTLNCHALATPSAFPVYFCSWTKSCLRAFPLLGVSIIMAVRLRMMLQRRIYYRMLAHDILLDFTNSCPWTDFVFWVLSVSMINGWAHFGLVLWYHDNIETLKQVITQGLAPTGLFLLFFKDCCDIESLLIPLNSFFEDNRELAQLSVSREDFMCMDEKHVKEYVIEEWDGIITSSLKPTLQTVLKNIKEKYKRDDSKKPVYKRGPEFHRKAWFRGMWPGLVLLDPRLTDLHSIRFRSMFSVFLFVSLVVQALVFVTFGMQAYHNLYIDVYLTGRRHDVCAFLVAAIHMFVVGLMLWNIMSSKATQFYKLLGYKRTSRWPLRMERIPS